MLATKILSLNKDGILLETILKEHSEIAKEIKEYPLFYKIMTAMLPQDNLELSQQPLVANSASHLKM